MDEQTILMAACASLGCLPEQVLSYHVYNDCIVLVVDWGIAGGKKHVVPLDKLVAEKDPEKPAPRPARRRGKQWA